MSHLEEQSSDTHLMPVVFRNGTDRRKSARIPLVGPVRMGPPSGEPYATVSARDVSAGGLFIDADRPVKVGARFSAEVQLAGGGSLYIAEAEVAYNREAVSGSGFGVRFVDPAEDVIEAIDREIEKAREALGRIPSLPPVSSFEVVAERPVPKDEEPPAPVLRPARADEEEKVENATEILLHDTMPPLPREPMLGDDAFDFESEAPEAVMPSRMEEWMRTGHDLKARVLERSRRMPLLWTTLAMTGGVLVVSAIGLALWSGTRAEAVEPVALVDRGVTATTHHALMGDLQMPDVVAPKKAAAIAAIDAEAESLDAKRPLPPLVYVDELDKKLDKKPAVAAPKEETALVATVAAKTTAVKTFVAKTLGAKVEVKKVDAKPAVKKIAAEPAKVAAKSAVKSAPKTLHTKIGLAANAKVLKTHALRAPDRFVIDVTGQDKAPAMPGVSAGIKSIRFGKHPDFSRIVIETTAPIDNGRTSKKGAELSVAIDLK